jgi:hypothetical protein
VAFLKRLVLTQNPEALPARLALLKSEIVNICSEMLTLQRTNFEREWLARPDVEAPPHAHAAASGAKPAAGPARPGQPAAATKA